MKTALIFLLIPTMFVLPASAPAGGNKLIATTIPAFPLEGNDMEITRLAQRTQYFDRIGLQAGLMGSEDGSFEMWVWPWKPLRNFGISSLTI